MSYYDFYLGADPGKNGGLTLLSSTDRAFIQSWAVPKTPLDLLEHLKMVRASISGSVFTMVERVHSMFGDSAKSMYTFGLWNGYLEMALLAADFRPLDTVRPEVWMKCLGCMTKGDKNITKAKAQALFPWVKVTHAIADSMLLAYYARNFYDQKELQE